MKTVNERTKSRLKAILRYRMWGRRNCFDFM